MTAAPMDSELTPREIHRRRRKMIVKKAPQVKRLYGYDPGTLVIAAVLVPLQFGIAAILADQPFWVALLAASVFGAFINHYLNVVIHEATHNLVLGTDGLNKAVGIFANLPGVAPSAIAFRHYHLLHHKHLGMAGLDVDVAPSWQARFVGHSLCRKVVFLLCLPVLYSVVNPLHVQRRLPFDRWVLANLICVIVPTVAVVFYFGWTGFAYLALSSYFSVGPHPSGAHIIEEHLIYDSLGYATASYYGAINAISINYGHHVEHHDFPNVPGSQLARLHALAPQGYKDQFAHRSRLKTLWQFVVDRRIGLDSRILVPAPATH